MTPVDARSGADDTWRKAAWNQPPVDRRTGRPWPELGALTVMLLYNITINTVDLGPVEVPAAIAFVAILVGIARQAGLTWDHLGLRSDRWRRGLGVGGIAAAIVLVAVAAVAIAPASREYFADDRFVGVSGWDLSYETLVRIPLGTAAAEELAFRGVLLGLLLRRWTPLRAVLATAILFGVWHVLPTLSSLATNPAGDELVGAAGTAAAIGGTILGTGVAGVLFAWLRLRANSLVAPVIAHAAINAGAYLAGWLIVTNGLA